jgi:predicted dehydrogenase
MDNAIIAPVLGVDPNEQARASAAALGIATAPRFDDALANTNIDAVILCTPQQHHAEQIIAAARSGRQPAGM